MDFLKANKIFHPGMTAILIALAFLIYGCEKTARPPEINSEPALEMVLNTGQITMITINSPQTYYEYRDEATGFEYDLAKAFADYLGVELKVETADTRESMVRHLRKNPGAFIAAGLSIIPGQELVFSDPYMSVQQHVIVRRDRKNEVRQLEDLKGKTLVVRKGTPYPDVLNSLADVRSEDRTEEELVQQVVSGEVDAAVMDSHIARMIRRYYPQSAMACSVDVERPLAWAVLPGSSRLLARINDFFKDIQADEQFREIYDRYYGDVDDFDYTDVSAFHRKVREDLPPYLAGIRQAAKSRNFDWRLVAAQMYQESHYRPDARSRAGALGLMQITRQICQEFRVTDPFNPKQNIKAGVGHLRKLYDMFEGVEKEDRLRFALGAYNIGLGHIEDARRLAGSRGLDPNRWASLEQVLPLLSQEKYHRHTIYGYCRGMEPVEYVQKTMYYYDILKRRDITTEESGLTGKTG